MSRSRIRKFLTFWCALAACRPVLRSHCLNDAALWAVISNTLQKNSTTDWLTQTAHGGTLPPLTMLGDSAKKKTIRFDSMIISIRLNSIRFDETVYCLLVFDWTHLHHHTLFTMAMLFCLLYLISLHILIECWMLVFLCARLFSCIISACMMYYCNTVRWAWLDWGLSGWLTTLLQCFDRAYTVGWVNRPVKTV